jgi:hypothetical protein
MAFSATDILMMVGEKICMDACPWVVVIEIRFPLVCILIKSPSVFPLGGCATKMLSNISNRQSVRYLFILKIVFVQRR